MTMKTNQKKRVVCIHTVHQIIPDIHQLIVEMFPGIVTPVHILDEGVLLQAIEKRKVDAQVRDRVHRTIENTRKEDDMVLVTCSTIAPCIDSMSSSRSVLLRIDEPMAKEAVSKGSRIAVIGTLPTAIISTVDLIDKKAVEAQKEVQIKEYLCEKAFDLLKQGDIVAHDTIVSQNVEHASKEADVIVFAQASMINALSRMNITPKKEVLTSTRSGVAQLKKVFG